MLQVRASTGHFLTVLILLAVATAALAIAQPPPQLLPPPPLHSSLVMVHDDESLQPSSDSAGKSQLSCQPARIEVDMCNDMQYNHTARRLPGYAKQADVAYVLRQFKQLVKAPCAPFLKLFVCSMHLPLCNSDQQLLVRPCREFCLRIQGLCSPLLKQYGHPWPQNLDCEGLNYEQEMGRPGDPTGQRGLCLRPSNQEFEEALRELRISRSGSFDLPPPPPPPPAPPQIPGVFPPESATSIAAASPKPTLSASRCSLAEFPLVEGGGGGGRRGSVCAPHCRADFQFSRADKDLATDWMLGWSAVCFAAAVLAVATFALDSDRFRFPERPIVWVAASHLVFAGAHLLRVWLGPGAAGCARSDPAGQQLHRVSRHAGHWCAVIFLLLYFASLAGCLWWLLLTVCWYLCAARKWAHEAIEQRSVWLHLLAWGGPLLLSVSLLVLHRVEADELTHLCIVDASDRMNLLAFVVAPAALCLLAGLGFLVSALCSSASVRHSLKWSGNEGFRRLEKLMTKICLFSFLFALPTGCVLAVNVYELMERDKWTASLEKVLSRPHCVNSSGLLSAEDGSCSLESGPSSALAILKIFMSLAAGLPACLLVWCNGKSLTIWKRCLCRGLPGGCCGGADGGSARRDQQPLPPVPQSGDRTAAAGSSSSNCPQQPQLKLQSLRNQRSSYEQQYQQQQQQRIAAGPLLQNSGGGGGGGGGFFTRFEL